jgi:iron complex transport system permease protein
MAKQVLLPLLLLLTLASPFVGSVDLDLGSVLDPDAMDHQIFFELRLPRLVLAFFTGALLALSGWLFQTLFRNGLMTPYTLGISGGAVLGTGIATVLGLHTLVIGVSFGALFGFMGALCSVALLLWLSRYLPGREGNSLLLLGIALSFFFSAALMVLFAVASAMQSHSILLYTMGSLSTLGYSEAAAVVLSSIVLLFFLYARRFELAILGVNEEHARLKGIDTRRLIITLLVLSSLVIGVAISVTGPIGFVGLIIPHMVRKIYRRANHRLILPVALYGGLFLAACDTLSRLPQLQSELPIGIVTAFIGGPFFIYLIIKGRS